MRFPLQVLVQAVATKNERPDWLNLIFHKFRKMQPLQVQNSNMPIYLTMLYGSNILKMLIKNKRWKEGFL